MRRTPRRPLSALAGLGMALGLGLAAAPARADSLVVDPGINHEASYIPFDELSYEVIVEGMVGFRADVRLRLALHNNSARDQDLVLSLALPRDAEIHGLRVARGGEWRDGVGTDLAPEPGRRDPGTILVHELPPFERGDLPGAELVGFSLAAGSTTQVELRLLVPPRMRGDRWEIVLPDRGNAPLGLARERRVLVRGAPSFWLDGQASEGQPVLTSRAQDRVTVAWPATLPSLRSKTPTLATRYEVMRDASGDGGNFRLYLRLGATAPLRPDHVVVVVDRSKSTSPAMHREALTTMSALFDALPPQTTFDAIAFARSARPLLDADAHPRVSDVAARQRVATALDAGIREQGTDLAAALELAGERLRGAKAKRPLILVLTDGMLPLSITPADVEAALGRGLGRTKRLPELLFAVDEPILARQGLDPDHPVSLMAAGLGARISLETLAQKGAGSADLLSAPQVLRDLAIAMPASVTFDEAAPKGLVAGSFVVLSGTYEGKRAPSPRIKGKIGHKKIQLAPHAETVRPPPAALVATVGPSPVGAAASEGFATPPWLTRNHQRSARLEITWAGRGGYKEKGYLDERIFRRYLGTRVFPRARACYNRALTRDQTLGGRVVFELEVGKGEVMFARIAELALSHEDPELRACLLEAAWALDIPAGQLDDQLYRLRYPLVLNPPADGKPALSEDPLGPGTVELLLGNGARAPAEAPTGAATRPRRPAE
ncbi:MAG: VWA domain-containing protein [Myxococcales bacterium]|nr:VWA domain-containing protein [Myxococcales bacterium]